MKILIACEESQEVCKAFRELGHEAYSCDILPCSGGHPEWHFQFDVTRIMNGYGTFKLQNEDIVNILGWDLMIAHPPCTYLSVSGAQYWKKRIKEQEEALEFVKKLLSADIPKIALENPVGKISTSIRKPDQYIQPFEHGHKISKKTGLWLKNLPKLEPTNQVEPEWIYYKNGGRCSPDHYKNAFSKNRGVLRSKTYPGIAKAMAEQWGILPCTNQNNENDRVHSQTHRKK